MGMAIRSRTSPKGRLFDGAEVSVTEHFTQPQNHSRKIPSCPPWRMQARRIFDSRVERKGLGTPATRAAVIEKLVAAGFVERKGKSLIPTKAGINLVTVLPEPLTSPMLTAEWEQKLTEIAKGGADPTPSWMVSARWSGRSCQSIPAFPRTAKSCLPRRRK